MTIGTKIKTLRAAKGMSQNELADSIGVSRQAITKWETDNGVPEIENLSAISKLFDIPIDALVKEGQSLYSSIIQYDIDSDKDFDIDAVPSNTIIVEGGDSEKIRVEMLSDTIPTLDSDLKIAIEDRKRKMVLKMNRRNDLTESMCRSDLTIRIRLPRKYVGEIELKSDVKELHLRNFDTEDMEFNGEASLITLDDVHGEAEMDVRSDCLFRVRNLDGSLEINQIGKNSIVEVPPDLKFRAINAGRKCELTLSDGLTSDESCKDFIEVNGMKNTLNIKVGKWDTATDQSSSSQ